MQKADKFVTIAVHANVDPVLDWEFTSGQFHMFRRTFTHVFGVTIT